MRYFSISEIAELIGISARVVRIRSKCWVGERKRQYGKGMEYPLEGVSEPYRSRLVEALDDAESGLSVQADSLIELPLQSDEMRPEVRISDVEDPSYGSYVPQGNSTHSLRKNQSSGIVDAKAAIASSKPYQVVQARQEVLRVQEAWCAQQGIENRVDCDTQFSAAFTAGEIEVSPECRSKIQKVSRATLARWRGQMKSEGAIEGLRPKHRGQVSIFDEQPLLQEELELWVAYCGDHATPAHVARQMPIWAEFEVEAWPNEGQIRRRLEKLMCEKPALWTYYQDPDRARGLVVPAFGRRYRYEEMQSNDLWELDSSPMDVMLQLEDGKRKRYALVACIDVATRRAMLYVSPTSNGEAICLVLRKAMLAWGVPKAIKTDNGSDYISKRVGMYLQAMQIEQKLCNPGQPMEKPLVERFFRSFQHHDLELIPGFIGHNVADRKAITNRGQGDKCLQIPMTPERFQKWADLWCSNYANQPHKGLRGLSPNEYLANCTRDGWIMRQIADTKQLDFLLLERRNCTVTRRGVQIKNRLYVAVELEAEQWIGRKVHAVWDPDNPNECRLFSSQDLYHAEFICTAQWTQALSDQERTELAAKVKAAGAATRQHVGQVKRQARKLEQKIAENPEKLLDSTANVAAFVRAELEPEIPAIAAALQPQALPAVAAVAESSGTEVPKVEEPIDRLCRIGIAYQLEGFEAIEEVDRLWLRDRFFDRISNGTFQVYWSPKDKAVWNAFVEWLGIDRYEAIEFMREAS
ncbi:MAG: DDE-type integrase/transposase/recombinase [Cyanobacteria bacterium P01_H01_bin.121]